MFGSGVLKGLGVTLKEFVATYVDDVKKIPSRYAGGKEELDQTAASAQNGIFTVQYPEERRKLSERFRYIPMLVYDAETGEDRCTACGICAKVCPPQCIWIVRAKDEKGKPITQPAEFFIDTTICMNCGLCAEFCPFDAIKMNNDYEIAAQQRMPYLVFDLKELRVPTTYYARIKPTDWADEEAARAAKEAEKAAKPERPAKAEAGSSTARSGGCAPKLLPRLLVDVALLRQRSLLLRQGNAPRKKSNASRLRRRPAAQPRPRRVGRLLNRPRLPPRRLSKPSLLRQSSLRSQGSARRKRSSSSKRRPPHAARPRRAVKLPRPHRGQRQFLKLPPAPVAEVAPPEPPAAEASQAAPAVTGVGAKRTPEEIERLKAEAAARRAAKAGQGGG